MTTTRNNDFDKQTNKLFRQIRKYKEEIGGIFMDMLKISGNDIEFLVVNMQKIDRLEKLLLKTHACEKELVDLIEEEMGKSPYAQLF